MRTRFRIMLAMAFSALLSLGTAASGQTVTINFTGIANPSVQTLGAYGGYYTGTVTANGVTTAASPGFICDDYNNEVFLPSESWQATATSFSSLASNPGRLSSTLLGNTLNLNGYAAIAYLSNLMASTQTTKGQADISAAIWYIGALGTGSYKNSPFGSSVTDSISWSSLDSAAQAYVKDLLGLGSGGSYPDFGFIGSASSAAIAELESSHLWIYTPTGQGIWPAGDPYPQEFIASVAVPEGGAALFYLLLAALSCAGALYLRHRSFLATGHAV